MILSHLLPLVVLLILDSAVPLPTGESQWNVTDVDHVNDTSTPQTDVPVATLMRQTDGKVLRRTKRGWMWNTFVVMEEYTGNLDQYVGKVRIVCAFVCVCVYVCVTKGTPTHMSVVGVT